MSGIPPAALALAIDAGVITTSAAALGVTEAPSRRSKRRAMIEVPGFRQELRDAGWRKSQIKRWIVTGETP